LAKEWLRKSYAFIGRVTIGGGWMRAPIFLQQNLDLHIFLPGSYSVGRDEHRPEFIEGQIENWNIKIINGATSVSYSHSSFNSLNKLVLMAINKEAKNLFPKDHQEKIWSEITFSPKTVFFEKIDLPSNIPDEWGLTFYPPKNNRILFHFFNNNRHPRGFSNIFTTADSSVYFSNTKQWTFDAFYKRLKLLTSSLSFFTGAPVTYELLVGRFKRDILYVQIKNISNPNAYLCPSKYNGRIEIKQSSLSTFPSKFVRRIEELFNDHKHEKVVTLLSYFRMLYMALYDEAKIAFSFQVMESLAKYKGIEFGETYKNKIIKGLSKEVSKKMCPACNSLLRAEIKPKKDDFIQYIDKALNVLKADNQFSFNSDIIKSIALKYRNEIFHGGFFEGMSKVENLVKTMPEGYQRDLPILFQALAASIGVNFLLGIDFDQIRALKSSNECK
jgi:hypothetical protein